MDRQDRWLERAQRHDRFRHRIGNVVQFQVEEDRQPEVGDVHHPGAPVAQEELQPQLDSPGMAADRLDDGSRLIDVGGVDRDVDRPAHASRPMVGAGAGAGLGG